MNNKEENIAYFDVGNELTLYNVVETKEKIEDLLNREKEVVIRGKEIQSVDLAGIQLLIATKRHAAKLGKQVKLEVTFTNDINSLLKTTDLNIV